MITRKDINEVPFIRKLITKVDNIDGFYVDRVSDDIFQKQPFYLTVLLGYRLDTTPLELEEIMKIYFIIWEYFQTSKAIHVQKVTEDRFNIVQDRHIAMLQYTDGETDPGEIKKIYDDDMRRLKSKALFAAVHLRFNLRPVLISMDGNKKAFILIGVKSFIECFETLESLKCGR